jgi:apolipoprotein N-acyltransferase
VGRRVFVVFYKDFIYQKILTTSDAPIKQSIFLKELAMPLNIVKTKKIIKTMNWELVIVQVVCGLVTFHLFAIMICSLLAWLASFMLNDGPTHFPTLLFVFLSVSLCLFLFLCLSACLSLFLYLREIISKQKLIDF